MSNRDALRRLSKRLPSAAEADSIIVGLHKEGDRTAAIIAAAMVESVLEQLLTSSFKSKSNDLLQRLFENRGPLSDFNSKILIGEAYRVIGVKHDELQRVRHIRNCFAHARQPVTFDTPEIAREVEDFAATKAIKQVREQYEARGEASGYETMGHKASYLLSCHLLMIIMEQEHIKLGGAALISKPRSSPEK